MRTHLCFHGIGTCVSEREPGESQYWVATPVFLDILDAVSGDESVDLSFDDGNRSDVDIALPALAERRLTATFFALAGRLDDPMSLDPKDLRRLRDADMRIGNHGWTHTPWRRLDEPAARREIVDARRALQDAAQVTITEAALPLGRYDRSTLRRARQAGYRHLYTSDRFPARPASWLQARYSITAEDTVESVVRMVRHGGGIRGAQNLGKSLVKRAL